MSNGSVANCTSKCWAAATLVAVLVFLMLKFNGDYSLLAAIVLAVITLVLLGMLLVWLGCTAATPAQRADVQSSASASASTEMATATAAAALASTAAAPAAATVTPTPPTIAPDPEPVAPAEAMPTETAHEDPDAASPADTDEAATLVKPSAPLAGERDLAGRKGAWKYGPVTKDGTTEAVADEDEDQPGSDEGSDAVAKPQTLDAARDGAPDDLKEIKGVGPKLEMLLHSMGFYHFDQVAAWSAQEVAWVDANLAGFKGRVSRDDWVAQAKILADGGVTEFSKRARDGDVY